jgi:hypothetical protein
VKDSSVERKTILFLSVYYSGSATGYLKENIDLSSQAPALQETTWNMATFIIHDNVLYFSRVNTN